MRCCRRRWSALCCGPTRLRWTPRHTTRALPSASPLPRCSRSQVQPQESCTSFCNAGWRRWRQLTASSGWLSSQSLQSRAGQHWPLKLRSRACGYDAGRPQPFLTARISKSQTPLVDPISRISHKSSIQTRMRLLILFSINREHSLIWPAYLPTTPLPPGS
eukprot:SM000365S13720  [mRNA]  locus=s365:5677:6419:+ [translate_table: standard]